MKCSPCWYCKTTDDLSQMSNTESTLSRVICTRCGLAGHTAKDIFSAVKEWNTEMERLKGHSSILALSNIHDAWPIPVNEFRCYRCDITFFRESQSKDRVEALVGKCPKCGIVELIKETTREDMKHLKVMSREC